MSLTLLGGIFYSLGAVVTLYKLGSLVIRKHWDMRITMTMLLVSFILSVFWPIMIVDLLSGELEPK